MWLLLALVMGMVLALDLTVRFKRIADEQFVEQTADARTIRSMLMSMRRIYQQQFIDSGLPLNAKTIGFLPAHSIGRISRDFPNWDSSGVSFSNVSDRPRNPDNQADRFELEAMDWFRSNPKAEERLQPIKDDQGVGWMHYTAPIWIEPFCLKCHGDASDAPENIRETYKNSYGYQLGDLRGVMSIKLPLARYKAAMWKRWFNRLGWSLFTYALIFFALGLFMDRLVLRRLALIQAGTRRVAEGSSDVRVSVGGEDELADLACSFNHMADEVSSRTHALADKSDELERHSNHLQELVDERTLDLNAAKESAERANRAKSEFMKNVSHELRTPLHAVRAFAKFGIEKVAEAPREKLGHYFERIHESSERLTGLIDDLLDLSSLDAGKLSLKLVPTELGDLAGKALTDVAALAARRNINVHLEKELVSAPALCDVDRIRQVLDKVLGNAIKYSPDASTIRIRLCAYYREIHDNERDEYLQLAGSRLQVIDQGPGIPEAELESIFERFLQSSKTQTGAGGAGLGLPLAREIMRLHHGRIAASNNPDGGACISIDFPLPPA